MVLGGGGSDRSEHVPLPCHLWYWITWVPRSPDLAIFVSTMMTPDNNRTGYFNYILCIRVW